MLELVITIALTLLVTSLSALFLQSSSRALTRTTMRSEMQQQALIAMQKLLTDLRRSCCAGIAIRSDVAPRALAICPLSQPGLRAGSSTAVLNNGELLWSDFFLIYFYDAQNQTLNYREWPPGNPTAATDELDITKPRRLTTTRIAQILSLPATRQLTLVTGLTGFDIIYPPGGSDLLLIQPLTIKLTLQRKGNTGRPQPETFTYQRSVFIPEQR